LGWMQPVCIPKHGGYKQVLSVGRCKPYTGNGCRSICCNRILNRSPIGSYRLYIETSF
jgi:hypothetical protein